LGDFAGEIGFSPDGKLLVAGSAGNPASSSNAQIAVYRLLDGTETSHVAVPLADTLTVSSAGEVIASSGDVALVPKAGIAVYLLGAAGDLQLEQTFLLDINALVVSSGKLFNDQIKRIVLKE
jgi:hypothetical protein